MKRKTAIAMALIGASIIGAPQVYAFQEQEVPVTAPEPGPTRALKHKSSNDAALTGINPDSSTKSKDSSGLYIPGLGALPSLNFGLELLYDEKTTDSIDEPGDNNISIKGRLKHNF